MPRGQWQRALRDGTRCFRGDQEYENRVRDQILAAYLLLMVKSNLSNRHASILVEVRPRGVDDVHVLFLVALMKPGTLLSQGTMAMFQEDFDTSQHKRNLENSMRLTLNTCTSRRYFALYLPSIEFALVSCAQSSTKAVESWSHS